MITVGLTGNIGSGKTTVCRVFEMLDIPVYHADEVAKRFLDSPEVAARLENLLGEQVLDENGKPNRKRIAGIVFRDSERLRQLNALIHPMVRKDFKKWLKMHSTAPYVIQEAAILFETGHYRNFDKTILVTAPERVRIERVCQRDGLSVADVQARMQHQSAQQELEKLADFTIHNDGRLLVIPQILRLHELLGGTLA